MGCVDWNIVVDVTYLKFIKAVDTVSDEFL